MSLSYSGCMNECYGAWTPWDGSKFQTTSSITTSRHLCGPTQYDCLCKATNYATFLTWVLNGAVPCIKSRCIDHAQAREFPVPTNHFCVDIRSYFEPRNPLRTLLDMGATSTPSTLSRTIATSDSTSLNVPITVFTAGVPSTSLPTPSGTSSETANQSSSQPNAIQKGGLAVGVIIGILVLTILIGWMYQMRKRLSPCLGPNDNPMDETPEVILNKKTGHDRIPPKHIRGIEARNSQPVELASHNGIQPKYLSSQSGHNALVELDSIEPMRTLEPDETNRFKRSTAHNQSWSTFLSNNNRILPVPEHDEVRSKAGSNTNYLAESKIPFNKDAIHEKPGANKLTLPGSAIAVTEGDESSRRVDRPDMEGISKSEPRKVDEDAATKGD